MVKKAKSEKKVTKKRRIGNEGEDLACKFLISNGYTVIERNFSCKIGEIDIIAIKDKTLAFIEVKSRKSISCGLPCQAVNRGKQLRIKRSAEYYILSCGFRGGGLGAGTADEIYRNYNISFDIIEILRYEGETYLRHLVNAFN